MKWIPVSERLPAESDCNKSGYVMSYHRSDRQWGWPTKFGFSKWNRVTGRTHTHWMPLPPTPAESPSLSSAEEAIGERKFSLKEALGIFDAGEEYGADVIGSIDYGLSPVERNKQDYFKEKFGIDI